MLACLQLTVTNCDTIARVFSKANKVKFANDLASTDWSVVFDQQDANCACKAFSAIVTKLFESNFPLVKISRARYRDKKWFTSGLRKSCLYKNKLIRLGYRQKVKKMSLNIKTTRSYSTLTQKAEIEYYNELFNHKTNTIKKTFV